MLDQSTILAFPTDTGGLLANIDSSATADDVFIFQVSDGIGPLKFQRIADGAYRAAWVISGVTDQTSRLAAVLAHTAVKEVVLDMQVTVNGSLTIPAGKKLTIRGAGKIVGTGTLTVDGVVQYGIRQDAFGSSLTVVVNNAEVYVSRDRKVFTSDNNILFPKNAYITRILVKPSTALTAFKVGTTAGAENIISAQPLTGSIFTPINIDFFCDNAAMTLYFGGITSSTEIIVFYE